MSAPPTSWKSLTLDVVKRLPATFTLADILRYHDYFAKHFPENRFVDAKIRQTLQILRDQGTVRFLGSGRYERLDVAPAFSPLIDATTAAGMTSNAQIARVVLETWAELNLYCLDCEADGLSRLPANTPVADFACASCGARYQLKAKNGRFAGRIEGAAYQPTLRAIRDKTMPEHVLVTYDLRFRTVVFVDAIPGASISEDRVVARKPLSASAKRAGWQGCTIDVSDLPTAPIVRPAGIQPADVRATWRVIR